MSRLARKVLRQRPKRNDVLGKALILGASALPGQSLPHILDFINLEAAELILALKRQDHEPHQITFVARCYSTVSYILRSSASFSARSRLTSGAFSSFRPGCTRKGLHRCPN